MDKRRPDTLSDLRRQRVRIRRIGICAMLAGGLFALTSCEALTRRTAASAPASAASSITPHGAAVEHRS
jgi:hypothetical protein